MSYILILHLLGTQTKASSVSVAAVVIIFSVVIGVLISIYKAEKLKKAKREESKREEKKYMPPQSAKQPQQTPEPRQSNGRRIDPFPSYEVDPFDTSASYANSLTAAQLNEWMLDFAAAEKAGTDRPPTSEIKPLFARYLLESGFNYRLVRKLRGYAPQNKLNCKLPCTKSKPQNLLQTESNPQILLPQPEQKLPPDAYVRQKSIVCPLPKKNFKERRELYESFYRNRD